MWPSLYRLFEEVRKHSTVALSGESADEVFGGYRWFHDPEAIEADTFPWLTSVTGKYFDGKTLFDRGLLRQLDMPAFLADSYRQAIAETPMLVGESPVERRMRELSYLNLTRFVQTLLDRKDRMSMAVGLEVRVPFCDHRLVEYAFNIPWSLKAFDGREKSILRAATRDLLPSSITDRVKSPYPLRRTQRTNTRCASRWPRSCKARMHPSDRCWTPCTSRKRLTGRWAMSRPCMTGWAWSSPSDSTPG